MKKIHGIIMLIILVIIDQVTKIMINNNFILGEEKEIIKNVFSLEYVRNTGAAWGMFPNGTIFFAIFSCIVCVMLFILYIKIPKETKYNLLACIDIMLIAGAVGNLIDRVFRHYVVDFFYFKLIDFPVFNVADIYVTVSAIVLIIVIMFYYKEDDLSFLEFSKKKDTKDKSEVFTNKIEDNNDKVVKQRNK